MVIGVYRGAGPPHEPKETSLPTPLRRAENLSPVRRDGYDNLSTPQESPGAGRSGRKGTP